MEDLDFQNELSKLLYTDSTALKRIHIDDINENNSSDSEPDGRPLDEDYMKNQPPPCDYNIIKDLVVKVGTKSIGTKRKKKKKKKTNKSSVYGPTKLSVKYEVSPTQASEISESDINPFNALLDISDDNPADMESLYPLDSYSDTKTIVNTHCEDDSSNFEFDFVSEVDGSWETAVNKKSKKLRNFQINANIEKSSSLVSQTVIANTTTNSKEENFSLAYSSSVNNGKYFFPELIPNYSNIITGTTSSEIHEETNGYKKKAKKRKRTRKKTSQISGSKHLTNIPAENETHMSNVLVSNPYTGHEASAQSNEIEKSKNVVIEYSNRCQDLETSKKIDDLFENTYILESIRKSLEIFNSTENIELFNNFSKENKLNEKFRNDFPSEDTRYTKFESVVPLYDEQLPTEKNKLPVLPQYIDEPVCLESQSTELKIRKKKKTRRKHLSASCNNQEITVKEEVSQQQSTIESESIVWDWQLYNNRENHEATQNKIHLFEGGESIHYSALSIVDSKTNVEKSCQIRKAQHFESNPQYPIEGSYLFDLEALHGDEVQAKDKLGNGIPLTPNENIDASLSEYLKSYTTCTHMLPEKNQTTRKKRRRFKKKCNSGNTQQSIPAAKLENCSPCIDNNLSRSATGGDYIISSTWYKNQASNEVERDLFEDIQNTRCRGTEWVINSHDLGVQKQLQQINKVEKETKTKSQKRLPIKESNVQDICIFKESDFPPLLISNTSTKKRSTMNIDDISYNAPFEVHYSTKNRHVEKEQSCGGLDVTGSKIYETEYLLKPHNDDRMIKQDIGNLETEIIRFFQSNIPYDFTANIFPTSHQYVDLFGRDNTTRKYVDKDVGKIYEQAPYSGTYVSQVDIFRNESKKNSLTPVKSDCAQNILLSAISKPASNVHICEQHGVSMKLSYLSNILVSHTEIMKDCDNISSLTIMIPANLFQYIQKDQKCQNNILEFLTAGKGLQQQTSLFFYNQIYEKSASIKEPLYFEEISQNNLYLDTYKNSEIIQKTYHSLEGVALTATMTNDSENPDASYVTVECKHVLFDDDIITNVINTNTCFEVMTSNIHYTVNSSEPFYLENDISHVSSDSTHSLIDHGMTDKRKLSNLANILAMNTEMMKIHDNISHVSVMIPSNLSKQIQKDQSCQNLILEFLTAGGATLKNKQALLFFYNKIDEKGTVGDHCLADYFYHEGTLYKKTIYDSYNLRSSNSFKMIDTYKTNFGSPPNSISCSLNNISTAATCNLEDPNDSCTNIRFKRCEASKNNEDQELLINTNTCFGTMPKSDSTQLLESFCSLEKVEPICNKHNSDTSTALCDNIQEDPHSGIVKIGSSYSTIIVENVVNLTLYCLFHLIKDVMESPFGPWTIFDKNLQTD
ncbi:unnamed protein product [Callosobruchus maculatus]|uniref:Uncharacterized protein n=1 Tax=Callosobruchus maculatus TaxID=64391 RepID=A0A653C5B7_CALMS|nr:unnamed protein product [Callosobruchus maculatus]